MLGERYGIPTEFTSYLVLEPGMNQRLQGNAAIGRVAGGVAPPAAVPQTAAARRDVQFEAAKMAAEQRLTRSLAAADMAAPSDQSLRKVNGHAFTMRDGFWTDVRYQPSMKTLTVKAFSKAYFDLVAQLPELRGVFAIGDKVIVVGRSGAIAVNDAGASELSASELAKVVREW